MIIQG